MRLALHWQILIGMLLGAVIGLVLNYTAGRREAGYTAPRPAAAEGAGDRRERDETSQLPPGIRSLKTVDTPDGIRIEIVGEPPKSESPADGAEDSLSRTYVIDGKGKVKTLAQLREQDEQAYRLFRDLGRSRARRIGDAARTMGDLFLRLLKMVAVPLIVSSLISGVMGLGDATRLGRMFGRTVLYYVCTSMLAITVGLLMVNVIRPGLRNGVRAPEEDAPEVSADLGDVLFQQLENLIPENPFASLAEANFLSVISFSLAFAIFATLVGGNTARIVRELAESAFQVMMAMTMAIIKLAPIGVFFMMLYVTATQGPDVFRSLFWYIVAVLCALAVHALIVLPAIVYFVGRRDPWQFAKAMSPALLTAFSSASSNGTLPLTLASVEQRAGIDNRVGSFVLPLGATVNMDGTALYEAVAVLFIAQLHFGHNLPLSSQILVAFTALLASIGAAGIPHAGLVMMVIILQVVGLPVHMQGIILAVDRVLDMCRTAVNVWSDSCGCAVVARLEASASKAGGGAG